ncbi:MAG TPA: FecR domain-containing protein [Flavisolibacter sp.]|nr:FecR domain-containing protein [Flavisolibacter sp.]
MNSYFNSIEEVIADERFLAWYFRTDDTKAKEWKRWLSLYPENKLLVDESIAYLDELHIQEREVPDANISAALERLDNTISTSTPVVNIKRTVRYWWISAAAMLLLLFSGFVFWNKHTNKTYLESAYGEVKSFQLPDGSQVTLNANSEIAISEDWNAGNAREVWLKGEAFFKVQKTKAKSKFVVHTDALDIVVTGTQFNVTSDKNATNVLLTEGSVTIITSDGQEMQMQPGEFVTIENKQVKKATVNEEKVLAWRQAKLVFDNTTMTEVAQIITKHYGVKVTLSDKVISEKKISGVMPNDSLDVLIQALEATGEFKITRTVKEIFISKP